MLAHQRVHVGDHVPRAAEFQQQLCADLSKLDLRLDRAGYLTDRPGLIGELLERTSPPQCEGFVDHFHRRHRVPGGCVAPSGGRSVH